MRLYSILGVVVLVLLSSATSGAADSKCDCPKDNPETHGRVLTLIDSEFSSTERIPNSGSLGFPKVVTVCMFFDPTNKGYPQELKLVVESSLDGRMWFPATTAGRESQASSANGCVQIAPTRYVRVGWPPAANVPSPGLSLKLKRLTSLQLDESRIHWFAIEAVGHAIRHPVI